jgi:hypothetical protein
MAKYLLLWEVDESRIPVDPKERGAGWKALMDMVKKDMSDGFLKDWGGFFGENSGFSIFEGTELELGTRLQQYVPYVRFEVRPVGSVNHTEQLLEALLK